MQVTVEGSLSCRNLAADLALMGTGSGGRWAAHGCGGGGGLSGRPVPARPHWRRAAGVPHISGFLNFSPQINGIALKLQHLHGESAEALGPCLLLVACPNELWLGRVLRKTASMGRHSALCCARTGAPGGGECGGGAAGHQRRRLRASSAGRPRHSPSAHHPVVIFCSLLLQNKFVPAACAAAGQMLGPSTFHQPWDLELHSMLLLPHWVPLLVCKRRCSTCAVTLPQNVFFSLSAGRWCSS